MTFRDDLTKSGSTTEELYNEVLGSSKTDDVLIVFDDRNGGTFSVEFVDFEDPAFRGFNVAGPLPEHVSGGELAANVSLVPIDLKDDLAAFESDAQDGADAVEELNEILDAMGVSLDDSKRCKCRQIETGFTNQLAKRVMNFFGMRRSA